MNETRCEECGCPVEDDMCLCYVCAQKVKRRCEDCGAVIEPDESICYECYMNNERIEYEVDEIRSAARTEGE